MSKRKAAQNESTKERKVKVKNVDCSCSILYYLSSFHLLVTSPVCSLSLQQSKTEGKEASFVATGDSIAGTKSCFDFEETDEDER
jgi:hypothetical protein